MLLRGTPCCQHDSFEESHDVKAVTTEESHVITAVATVEPCCHCCDKCGIM